MTTVCEKWSAKTYCSRGVGAAKHQLYSHPEFKRVFRSFGNTLQVVENSPADRKPIEVQAQEPLEQAAETSPGVQVDRVQQPVIETAETFPDVEVDREDAPECSHCFDDGFVEDESGLIKSCHCNSEPELSRQKAQSAIAPAAKTPFGSRSTAHQLLELFKSSVQIIEDCPGVEAAPLPLDEPKESEIAPGAKNHLEEESDRNPTLTTRIVFSDNFLARYTPPQSDNIRFQVEADGQLSLVDFEVLTEPEPPDPDDFESLDAFREAIALWDAQNPEPFAVSMDSMCEWAPCPEDWYEPEVEILPLKASSMIELPEQSEVMELSIDGGSSITCNFIIPTFDRGDEPPDTGIFARLPKPKPPKFPPQSASWPQVGQASRNYSETTPNFHRSAAGTSTQPARSPPGGDA